MSSRTYVKNRAEFEGDYFREANLQRDTDEIETLAAVIGDTFDRYTVLDIGCGLGFLVKHLRHRGLEAWGVDISEFATQEASVASRWCVRGDARHLTDTFCTMFDVLVMRDLAQVFELHDFVEVLNHAHKMCRRYLVFVDRVRSDESDPNFYQIRRSMEWYERILHILGWKVSRTQEILRDAAGDNNILVVEPVRVQTSSESVNTFRDPWLVRECDTQTTICCLLTSEAETREFSQHYGDLPVSIRSITLEGSRSTREEQAVFHSNSDYVLLCDDTTRLTLDWFLEAMAYFRDPQVGVIASPVLWNDQEEPDYPRGDYFQTFPLLWRTLAYQQCRGSERVFRRLGWRTAFTRSQIRARRGSVRDRDTTLPSVTIFTAFDDSKEDLIPLYLEVLDKIDYPREELHIIFYDDSKGKVSGVPQQLTSYLQREARTFGSITYRRGETERYWMPMDEGYYPFGWSEENNRYPVSVRVATIYNQMRQMITTDQVLVWESDTIPILPNFLRKLQSSLGPHEGGISGHYVCRIEKKSLAWRIDSTIPLVYEWVTPGSGVQSIDAVPHGLLLLNSWTLRKFQFSVLANSPRDFRGPDLVMGRDFREKGIPLKIDWNVQARHYYDKIKFIAP